MDQQISLIQLFIRADFIVKAVIIILIAASVYSWALILKNINFLKELKKALLVLKKSFGNQDQQKVFTIIYK